jgi:VWFA-related protein
MSRHSLLLCAAVIAAAQQVEPVYRTGAQLVQVDVVVRNDKGSVKGLTKDDFTIQDKGKPQTLAVFAMTEAGGGAAKATPLPSNVSSNRINSSGETARTATVILFDRLNILESQTSNTNTNSGGALSGLGAGAQARAGRQVLELLASLKGTEQVGLYSLFQDVAVVRDFTEDSAPLVEAAKRAIASPQKTGATPAEQALDAKLRDALTPGHPLEASVRSEITAKTFRAVARRMAGIPGRKSLIWIASSFPLAYGDDPNHRAEEQAEVDNIASLLGDANIALYSIDPRGAGTAFSQTKSSTSSSDDPSSSRGGGGKKGGGGLQALDNATSGSGLSGVESMEQIANQTGGKAFINVNDIALPIHEVVDSADVSYTLGFYVADKALDGKKHDVSVKVAKKPETSDAKLSYRKSYLALAKRDHPQMTELVADRLDANRIGVMAASVPAPNRPGIDAVQVRVDLKDLQFEKRVDKWFTSFDLALAIESGSGEPKVSVSPNSLSLTDDQLKQGLAGGVTIDNTVPAPDKAATLRVVIQDKSSGEAGSVRIPLPAK